MPEFNEFNEFKPRLKSPKTRSQLNPGLNIGKLNILSENQPYLSRGSNSLNSASEEVIVLLRLEMH